MCLIIELYGLQIENTNFYYVTYSSLSINFFENCFSYTRYTLPVLQYILSDPWPNSTQCCIMTSPRQACNIIFEHDCTTRFMVQYQYIPYMGTVQKNLTLGIPVVNLKHRYTAGWIFAHCTHTCAHYNLLWVVPIPYCNSCGI